MGAVYFYHLTHSTVEATLATLIGRALEQGWRVAVRGTARPRLEWLDEKLWLGPEEGFLPHGLAGGPHDAAQPVLLTAVADLPNRPDCLIAIDGADVSAAECGPLARVCILFDAGDAAQLDHARGQWRDLTGAGLSAKYWSEESGRWQMKAER